MSNRVRVGFHRLGLALAIVPAVAGILTLAFGAFR
jgi:hypothetical protein